MTDDPLTYFAAARLQSRLAGKRQPRKSELVTGFMNRTPPSRLVPPRRPRPQQKGR